MLAAHCGTGGPYFSASNPARLPVYWRGRIIVSTIRWGTTANASAFERAWGPQSPSP